MSSTNNVAAIAQRAGLVVARRSGEPHDPNDIAKKLRALIQHDIFDFAETCEAFRLVAYTLLIPDAAPEDIIESLRDERFTKLDFDKLRAFSAENVGMPRGGGMGRAIFFVKLDSHARSVDDLVKAIVEKYNTGSEKVRNFIGQAIGVRE
jgi:hypothetical protein